MRIGIITYHNTRNCGAVLQSYALLKTLKKLGCNAEIIDYHCTEIDNAYVIKKPWQLRSLKETVKWMLTISKNIKAQKKFDIFKSKNMTVSLPYDKHTIKAANESFDGFVTGSDQVWNFYLNGADENYILAFASEDKLKLAYAASLGYSKVPDEFKNIYLKHLPEFNGISVRETEGMTAVCEMGFNCNLVPDPTFLLSKEDYEPLEKSPREERYILVYTIASTPNIEKKAKELSQKTGLPIIWSHMSYKNRKGVTNVISPTCDEFLSLIKNAEYVLTSSFHGMAFSIIYEKNFYYDLSITKNNFNSRLTTLAQILDLSYREIKPDKDILSYEKIDYQRVNSLKDEFRNKGINYLKEGLGI